LGALADRSPETHCDHVSSARSIFWQGPLSRARMRSVRVLLRTSGSSLVEAPDPQASLSAQ
jgi:hypothetical protein